MPKAGSGIFDFIETKVKVFKKFVLSILAYIYCFVTIGEFIAYLIGWNLILEYAIGSASVVKGISNYIDAIFDKKISIFFREYLPINVEGFGQYADFFAFAIIIVITSKINNQHI